MSSWNALNLPMTKVNRIAYFPGVVYEYNVSREGNTCNEVAFFKTFHDLVTVSEKVIEEYESNKDKMSPVHRSYLKKHAYYRAKKVYLYCLLVRSPLMRSGLVERFDAFLRDNSLELYEEVEKEYVGNRLTFNYVKEWRVNKKLTLRFRMFMVAMKIYGKLRGSHK